MMFRCALRTRGYKLELLRTRTRSCVGVVAWVLRHGDPPVPTSSLVGNKKARRLQTMRAIKNPAQAGFVEIPTSRNYSLIL